MHETNLLKAGAAMIDITPPAGTHLRVAELANTDLLRP